MIQWGYNAIKNKTTVFTLSLSYSNLKYAVIGIADNFTGNVSTSGATMVGIGSKSITEFTLRTVQANGNAPPNVAKTYIAIGY